MTLYFGTLEYVWKWRDNYVSFLFIIVACFLLCYNYVICLFDVVTFFDDVRNRYYFGTFQLGMEITLQLRFTFVHQCDVFFYFVKLRYLFVRCSYNFWWRKSYVIFWYFRITYGNDVKITFHVCSPLWRIFYFLTITLFVCLMQLRFSMT